MSNRFVDRQPRVRRMAYQIIFAGLDRFSFEFGDRFLPGFPGVFRPGLILQIFITDRFRSRQSAPRLKISRRTIDRSHSKKWSGSDNILFGDRAFARSEKLVLILKTQPRADKARAFGLHRDFIELEQEIDLLSHWETERIFLKRTFPFGDDLFGRNEFDRFALITGVGSGNLESLLGHFADGLRSDDVAGGKAPCAFIKNADAKAEIVRPRDVEDLLLAREDRFMAGICYSGDWQ